MWLFTVGSFFLTIVPSIKCFFFSAREHLKLFSHDYRSQKAQPTRVISYMLERIHELEIYSHSGRQVTKIKNHLSLGTWAYKQAVDFQQSLGLDLCVMQIEKHKIRLDSFAEWHGLKVITSSHQNPFCHELHKTMYCKLKTFFMAMHFFSQKQFSKCLFVSGRVQDTKSSLAKENNNYFSAPLLHPKGSSG